MECLWSLWCTGNNKTMEHEMTEQKFHVVYVCMDCDARLIGGREAGKHRSEMNHHSIAKTKERVKI